MNDNELVYHIPVLLKESIDGMNLQPGGIYVDVTTPGKTKCDESLNGEKCDNSHGVSELYQKPIKNKM